MNKITNSKLKPQLETIPTSTLKYRFINRKQFQTLLNHKHHEQIN